MARKDEIFKTFLSHDLLKEKYSLTEKDLPNTVVEGLQSDIPIIKSIALIIQNSETPNAVADSALRNIVTTYLNTAI
jgi:hypothetical protein